MNTNVYTNMNYLRHGLKRSMKYSKMYNYQKNLKKQKY